MDVKEAGWSTIVYTDNKPKLAQKFAEELAKKACGLRKKLMVSERLSPEEAIRQASKAEEGPIIISDPADTVLGGTSGDSTCIFKEMLNQKITCTAFIPHVWSSPGKTDSQLSDHGHFFVFLRAIIPYRRM